MQIHPDQAFYQATDPTANPPVFFPVLVVGSGTEVAATTGAQEKGVGMRRKSSVLEWEVILLLSPMSRFTNTCNPKTSSGDGWGAFKKKRLTPGSGVTAVPGTTIQDGDREKAAARDRAFATTTKRISGTRCTAHSSQMTIQSSCVAPKCVQVEKQAMN